MRICHPKRSEGFLVIADYETAETMVSIAFIQIALNRFF